MSYFDPEEVQETKPCKLCSTNHSNEGDYCSIDCGYKDIMCNKYHCPICEETVYSLDNDPYCSSSHRKQAVDKYNNQRECNDCGAMFYCDKFTYTCSSYCTEEDLL